MASVGDDVLEVALEPTINSENVSPPKKPKKEDVRARLKQWQAEHGRDRGPIQPWQRPPRKQPLKAKKEGTIHPTESSNSTSRRPFSFRQDNAAVSAKVNCKWSTENNNGQPSASRAKTTEAPAAERVPTSVLQLRGSGNEQKPRKASGLQRAQSAVELLEKLPKAFDLAQWRAARRANYAERVREQENKRRQTLAAAQHADKPLPAPVANIRRQTMAVPRNFNKRPTTSNVTSSVAVKPATVNTRLLPKVPATSKWSTAKSTQTSTRATREASQVSAARNSSLLAKTVAASSGKSCSASVSKGNARPVAKPKPVEPKVPTSAARVKNLSGAAPKLKRLNIKSSPARKGTPPGTGKSKTLRRKSAFKPLLHSRPPRRSTLIKAIPAAKPNNPKLVTVPKPVPKKQKEAVATKRQSGISRRITTQRITLTALHRKGGKKLVQAKEGLVREVKTAMRKKQVEEIKRDSKFQVAMSVKKARSVSFYVPMAEEDLPGTPDEILRKSRLESWLQSKGRTVESFRHCRCFSDNITPDVVASKTRRLQRPPTPGRPTLTSSILSSVDAPKTLSDDRRLTINLNTIPLPINWDASPEEKVSHSIQNLSPEKNVVELNDVSDATFDATSPTSIPADLRDTLTELADSLQAGEPFFAVSEKLDELCETSPQVRKISKYWLCRAEVAKQAGNYAEVLRLLQLAFDHGAEPLSELLAAQDTFGTQIRTPSRRTPRRRRAAENQDLLCESSVVKFKIATPSARKSLAGNIFAITPVRRSIRLTRAMAKAQKFAADTQCVNTVEELPAPMRKSVVYKPNEALSSWDITVEYIDNTDSEPENNQS